MKHGSMAALTAALVMSSLAATAPAHAATTIGLTGNSSTSGSYGNTRTFSNTSNGETITVSASAWSINDGTITTAYLGAFGNGLGVTNRSEGSGGDGSHTIDNGGSNDFVVLRFNRSVSLLAATLSAYGDTDVTFSSLSGMPASPIMTLSQLQSGVTSLSNSFGDNSSRTASNGSPNFSSIWAIAALTPANATRDSFKLRSVQVSAAPAVPEPSTWAMMLLGFGAIGVAMRRRRSAPVSFNFA